MVSRIIKTGYPLRGKSSVCVMCLKYRIIIIIIISLGQISLRLFQTHHTHWSDDYTLQIYGLRNNS